MESVVREYAAWKRKKQGIFEVEYSNWLETIRDHKYMTTPVKPDLSFQAFIEEYEDSRPLDH